MHISCSQVPLPGAGGGACATEKRLTTGERLIPFRMRLRRQRVSGPPWAEDASANSFCYLCRSRSLFEIILDLDFSDRVVDVIEEGFDAVVFGRVHLGSNGAADLSPR
jgi:hypothetical protein